MDIGQVKRVFINERERRVRAGWRLLGQTVCFILILTLLSVAVRVVVDQSALMIGDSPGSAGGFALNTTLGLITVGVTVLPFVRYVDRRPLAGIGLTIDRAWLVDCGLGLGLGAGLMTLIFLVEVAFGWVAIVESPRASPTGLVRDAVILLGGFVAVGISEEVLSRGYQLTNIADGLDGFFGVSTRIAVGIAVAGSAGTFALLHLNNPNSSAMSTIAIFISGIFLSAGYVYTGRLGLPVGVHIAWNYFQAVVYGFPVSGVTISTSLITIEQRGPPLLTGGRFGPEAGLLGIGAVLLGTGIVLYWARAREGAERWRDIATYSTQL